MTLLKRALLMHLFGVLLLAMAVGILLWYLFTPLTLAIRPFSALIALGGLTLGAGLTALGLRDAGRAIMHVGLERQRDEFYLALASYQATDEGSRRAIFERYYQLRPDLDSVFLIPAQAQRREALLRLSRGPKVLEVGCANGGIAQYLREHNLECTGLDLSFQQLNHAVDAGAYVQGDAYRLPFADAAFDTVLLPEILEHLQTPALALAEAARVSANRVVLSIPVEYVPDPTHLNMYDLKSVRQLIDKVPTLEWVEEAVIPPCAVVACQRKRISSDEGN